MLTEKMTAIKGVLLLLLWSGLSVAAPSGEVIPEEIGELLALLRQHMVELKNGLEHANALMDYLQSNEQASQVAFSVSFKSEADNHVGPFSTDTTLIFDHIFTNIGNAYNQSTGVFTAPVSGVYQFRYHIFAGGDHGAGAKLLKNGEQILAAYNHKAPHDINTSQSVSLSLGKGDTVCLLLEAGWWVTAYRGHLTTFSGELLIYPVAER